MKERHMFIEDYARRKGITVKTVYNRIKREEIKTKKFGKQTLIIYEEN